MPISNDVFYRYVDDCVVLSFPTRRSSDLLEAILHPMVAAEERRFLARSRARRQPLAVLDIPLLFETGECRARQAVAAEDRKSTRLNSSHVRISYAVFCLKKKKKRNNA